MWENARATVPRSTAVQSGPEVSRARSASSIPMWLPYVSDALLQASCSKQALCTLHRYLCLPIAQSTLRSCSLAFRFRNRTLLRMQIYNISLKA